MHEASGGSSHTAEVGGSLVHDVGHEGDTHEHGSPPADKHRSCLTCVTIGTLGNGVPIFTAVFLVALFEEPNPTPAIPLIVCAPQAPAVASASPRGPPAV